MLVLKGVFAFEIEVCHNRSCVVISRLCGGLLEEGDQVVPVLVLLQATESHLGAGNVLLGVLKVGEQGLVVPGNALLLVGIGVGVAVDGTGLAAEQAVQGRADLVGTASLDGVALGAASLEQTGTLLGITWMVVSRLFRVD